MSDTGRPQSVGPVLIELRQLSAAPSGAERAAKAWRLLTSAQVLPDFNAAVDFALENGLALPCEVTDPKRQPNLTWVNPIDGSEMVWIPPGRCRLGPDSVPVEVGGFSLAKHPITNIQFAVFTDATGYLSHENVESADSDVGEYENGEFLEHWTNGYPPRGHNDHPVVYVSYLDSLAYCEWAGLSIPGEYQWEKAARGTDGRLYPWGSSPPYGKKGFAHYGAGDTLAVSKLSRARSPYGCEQLAGNVSTWCQMGNPKKFADVPPVRPVAKVPTARKPQFATVRGGAFKRAGLRTLRGCHRRKLSVIRRNDWVGIRPACFLSVRPAEG
jgi:formylglycine-generating enzyme required for sulfatase activity